MEKEIWKDIKGFEGLYKVSNYGRIKSLAKKKGWHFVKEKILKLSEDKDGYLRIMLSKKSKAKLFRVHRLVAETFLDKKDFKSMPEENRELINLDYLEVNHKKDKKNNNVDNLEWSTQNYNLHYGNRNKKISISLGKPVLQYDKAGNKIAEYLSSQDAGRKLNLSATHISECCRKIKYHNTHGGYIWKYKED